MKVEVSSGEQSAVSAKSQLSTESKKAETKEAPPSQKSFQKRGFPHMHIIFWLEEGSHMTPKELDQFVCAELPNQYVSEKDSTGKPMVDEKGKPIHKQDENGEKVINPLWTAVTSFMLRGPCGQYNPSLGCMVDGRCRFGYPKNYQAATEISGDCYPQYCQRQNSDNVYIAHSHGKWYTLTNREVVPYNKYLLYKYDCHFNVEFCHSVQAIKYTLKYLYKGSDQVTVTIEGKAEDADTYNEIEQFQNKRYVSAGEAAWCQRQNEVADRKPAVNRLQLHLPEEQTVYFDSNKKDESIERIEKAAQKTLTSFFELNC